MESQYRPLEGNRTQHPQPGMSVRVGQEYNSSRTPYDTLFPRQGHTPRSIPNPPTEHTANSLASFHRAAQYFEQSSEEGPSANVQDTRLPDNPTGEDWERFFLDGPTVHEMATAGNIKRRKLSHRSLEEVTAELEMYNTYLSDLIDSDFDDTSTAMALLPQGIPLADYNNNAAAYPTTSNAAPPLPAGDAADYVASNVKSTLHNPRHVPTGASPSPDVANQSSLHAPLATGKRKRQDDAYHHTPNQTLPAQHLRQTFTATAPSSTTGTSSFTHAPLPMQQNSNTTHPPAPHSAAHHPHQAPSVAAGPSNATISTSTQAPLPAAPKTHIGAIVTRINNGGNYGTEVRDRPQVDARLPQGIDISAIEICTFYPNALQLPDAAVRLNLAGWNKEDLAKAQLHATNTLTRAKLTKSENRIQKQLSVGGKLYFNQDLDSRWSKHNTFRGVQMIDDLTADGWDFRYYYDKSFDNLTFEDVELTSITAPVAGGNWPQGPDRLLLTQCLEYAHAHPNLKLTTRDFDYIIMTQGFHRSPPMNSDHDVQALERLKVNVATP